MHPTSLIIKKGAHHCCTRPALGLDLSLTSKHARAYPPPAPPNRPARSARDTISEVTVSHLLLRHNRIGRVSVGTFDALKTLDVGSLRHVLGAIEAGNHLGNQIVERNLFRKLGRRDVPERGGACVDEHGVNVHCRVVW